MTSNSEPDAGGLRQTLQQISELYEDSLRQHGVASQAVGWKDVASQRLRFDKLLQVIDDDDSKITVNDWGCGYGALFRYLDVRVGIRLQRYVGYDISAAMLAEARAYTAEDPRVQFVEGTEITETCDYGFVSGTFNVRFAASDEEWRAYIEQTLRMLSARSRRGFAFNLLSTYVDWKDPKLYYGDPLYFVDFARKNLSRYVTLLHDYPLYEWTIYVRRDG